MFTVCYFGLCFSLQVLVALERMEQDEELTYEVLYLLSIFDHPGVGCFIVVFMMNS